MPEIARLSTGGGGGGGGCGGGGCGPVCLSLQLGVAVHLNTSLGCTGVCSARGQMAIHWRTTAERLRGQLVQFMSNVYKDTHPREVRRTMRTIRAVKIGLCAPRSRCVAID